jgi:ribose-phosphate pyrophosphokinase
MQDSRAIFVGSANQQLGHDACALLHERPGAYTCRRFPDGEMQIELEESVHGRHVVIVQSTSPPVEQHLMELLLLADSCRRAGANRITACVPYFGYARQDRRTRASSLGARVAARMLSTAGFDRLLIIDAHTPAIEGFFEIPIDHLTAVPLLAEAAAVGKEAFSMVVAPDLGAVRLAREYARVLKAPVAVVHKVRVNGGEVEAQGLIGDVRDRRVLIVDDMLSTGGTIEAAVGALHAAGVAEPISLAVSHALLVGHARDVLARLPLDRVLAADTVTLNGSPPPHFEIVSVAPLIATAIERLR